MGFPRDLSRCVNLWSFLWWAGLGERKAAYGVALEAVGFAVDACDYCQIGSTADGMGILTSKVSANRLVPDQPL